MGFKDDIMAVIKESQKALETQEKRDNKNNDSVSKELNAIIKDGEKIKKELVGIIKDNETLHSQVKELKNALKSQEAQHKQFIGSVKKDFANKLSTQQKDFHAFLKDRQASFKQQLQQELQNKDNNIKDIKNDFQNLQKEIKAKDKENSQLRKQLPSQSENLAIRDAINNSEHLSGFARVDSIARLAKQYTDDDEYYKGENNREPERQKQAKETEKLEKKVQEEHIKRVETLSKGFDDVIRKLSIFGSLLLATGYKGFQWYKGQADDYMNIRYQASLAGISYQQAKAWEGYERSKGIPQGGLLKDLHFLTQQHNLVGWSQQMLPDELLRTLGFMGVNIADFQNKPQEFYGKMIEAVQKILDEGNPRKIGMIQQQLKSSGLTGLGTAMHDAHYSGYNLIEALSYYDELVEVPKELNRVMREFVESFSELQTRFDNVKNKFLVSISDFVETRLDVLNDSLFFENDKEKSERLTHARQQMKRILDDPNLSDDMRRNKMYELAYHNTSYWDYLESSSKQWAGILQGNLAGAVLNYRELYPLAMLNQMLQGATSQEQYTALMDEAYQVVKSLGFNNEATEQILSSLTGRFENTSNSKFDNDLFNKEVNFATTQPPMTNITINNEAGIHSQVSVDNPNNVSYNTN